MSKDRNVAAGIGLLVAAAVVAVADLMWVLPLLEAQLPALLGERAGDAALVEFLFNAVIFGVLIIAALIGGAVERRRVIAAGEQPVPMAAIGLAVGGFGVTAAVGYAALSGTLVAGQAPSAAVTMLAWGAGTIAIQACGEEIFFRGWLQPGLARRWSLVPALIVTAIAFAALHVIGGARAPVSLLNLLLGGLVFGLFAAQGRGLAAAAAMHWAWNATEQLVWGLDPNPGVGGFGAIADRDLVRQGWWGGSDEGLNASIGMTFVLVAILIPLLLKARAEAGAALASEQRLKTLRAG